MRAIVASRTAAINFVEERGKEFKIDCEFGRVLWFFFSMPGDCPMDQIEKER